MDERGQRIEISAIQLSCNISLSEQNAATSLQKKGKEKKNNVFFTSSNFFLELCAYVLMFLLFLFLLLFNISFFLMYGSIFYT